MGGVEDLRVLLSAVAWRQAGFVVVGEFDGVGVAVVVVVGGGVVVLIVTHCWCCHVSVRGGIEFSDSCCVCHQKFKSY